MSKAVDMTKFNDAIRKLAHFSGKEIEQVMISETGKILETAVRYTPKADTGKIRLQVEKDTAYRFKNGVSDVGIVYPTRAGEEWFSPGTERLKWYLILKWKVPNEVWRQYKRAVSQKASDFNKTLRRRLREVLARRGLTAATWVQIAEAIGAKVAVPSFVAKAPVPPAVGRGEVSTSANGTAITGENSSLVMTKRGTGQGIIDRAIRARLRFFEISLKKGAFNDLRSSARSYPDLFKDAA